MAEVKWVKITTDMFDNRKIKHLRRLPDGNNIVLIWVMLLTMAGRCNAGGMVFLTENIAYTPKMLADELDFEENTVLLALKSLEQFGMICLDENCFRIANWEEYQNIDGLEKIREQNRIRKKRQRERQRINAAERAALPGQCEPSRDNHGTITPSHATEEDKEEERELEEDKKKRERKTAPRETTLALFKRLLPDYLLPPALQEKMAEWIAYKTERKEAYKETGMKSLLRKVENNALTYGVEAVCNLIDDCMANNWAGIIFDKLKDTRNQPRKAGERNASNRANPGEECTDGRYGTVL